MTAKLTALLVPIFVLHFFCTTVYSQEQSSYNIKFLKAKIVDTTHQKDVLVVFQVSAKKEKNWPPILSMSLKYACDGANVKAINVFEKESNASITVFGSNVYIENKDIYKLIKHEINNDVNDDYWLLAFYIRDISPVNINTKTFIYGLWEKRNEKLKIEKTFDFKVDAFDRPYNLSSLTNPLVTVLKK